MSLARASLRLDDPSERERLSTWLCEEGYQVDGLPGVVDLLVGDPNSLEPGELERLLANSEAPAVLLLISFGSAEETVEWKRAGVAEILERPVSRQEFCLAAARALEHQRLLAENRRLRAVAQGLTRTSNLQSRSPALQRVEQVIRAVAPTRATLLIEGESGTGKTSLARLVHQLSDRRDEPFIELNCGALPETLLESELFGHVKGSFTGATRDKAGRFEAADRGTLFLDEIACASEGLQVKLLRAIQDRVVERVGENRTRHVDVRLIAATNSPLDALVEAQEFREDLYYRLKVIAVDLPPLRERAEDIQLLALHFLERHGKEHDRTALRFDAASHQALLEHLWPGNIRELENAVERAVLLATGDSIRPQDLGLAAPLWALDGVTQGIPQGASTRTVSETLAGPGTDLDALAPILPLKQALEGPEKSIIVRALLAHGGSRKRTAEVLQVNRATLFNKMKKYDLLDRDFGSKST